MMGYKLVAGLLLLAVVVEGGRWPCKQGKKKLDACRDAGYVIGGCRVGDGTLSKRERKRCTKLEAKYGESCDAYECEEGNFKVLQSSVLYF